MTSVRSELIAVLGSIEILSPSSFRLGGEPPLQVAAPGAMMATGYAQAFSNDPLTAAIQAVLYHRAYSHRLGDALPVASGAADPQLISHLSWANRSRDRLDPGWQVYQLLANGQIFVLKGDRQRSAMPGEYVAAEYSGAPPQIGTTVVLQIAREARNLQPGFYYMFGETASDIWDESFLIRIYFNCTSEHVTELIAYLTQNLNAYLVPYRMKALTDPSQYTRTDSMVLYCARRYFAIVTRIIGQLPTALLDRLEDTVPLFTKRLRAGVGLAEDPGNGESFGMHRCRLTAEGITDAWRQGRNDPQARLDAVDARFARNGLQLDRPYLAAKSSDQFEIVAPETVTA